MAAAFIVNLIRLKQEGFVPDRDLVVALTADEEGDPRNGVAWLLAQHRPLIDAELAINEGARRRHRRTAEHRPTTCRPSEKLYLSYRLEVAERRRPQLAARQDNAIYHLAEGLARLAAFEFPARVDEVTGTFFERTPRSSRRARRRPSQGREGHGRSRHGGARGRGPSLLQRHAADHVRGNAARGRSRRQRAAPGRTATVNCRVLPSETEADVRRILESCWRTTGSR